MTDKKDIEYYKARPEEYEVHENGMVRRQDNKQIVLPPSSGTIRTQERGRELANLRRAHGLRSKMLGLIDAYNDKQENAADKIDPDTLTDEELILAAGDAIRLLTKHMTLKFVASGNLRGMGEVFSKLTEPFAEDPRQTAPPPPPGQINATPEALMQLVQMLEAEKRHAADRARAIDIPGPLQDSI